MLRSCSFVDHKQSFCHHNCTMTYKPVWRIAISLLSKHRSTLPMSPYTRSPLEQIVLISCSVCFEHWPTTAILTYCNVFISCHMLHTSIKSTSATQTGSRRLRDWRATWTAWISHGRGLSMRFCVGLMRGQSVWRLWPGLAVSVVVSLILTHCCSRGTQYVGQMASGLAWM